MFRQVFYKENRTKVALGCLVIIALLGLILPGRNKEIDAEMQAELDAVRHEMVVLSQEIEQNNISQLGSLSARLDQISTTLNNLSVEVGQNKSDYIQRISNQQKMWEFLMGGEADYGLSISALEARIKAVEVYLNVVQTVNSLHMSYNAYNGFNLSCGWCPVVGKGWVGQQVPTGSRPIDVRSVKMYIKRIGLPSTVTLRVYATGANGLPVGTPVFSRTYDARNWPVTPVWQVLDVSGCVLSASKVYCFILEDVDGTASNSISVGFNYGGTYAGGSWVKSIDGGVSWSTTPTADAGFEIWGILK